MNIYRITNPCPKCNKIECPVAYDHDTNVMRRSCTRCGYQWDEEPCDAENGARVVDANGTPLIQIPEMFR